MRFFRKTFNIDLNDSLKYPSSSIICDSILKEESNVEFISKNKPITFKLDNIIYEVKVTMAHGGYQLTCKEIE